MEKGNADMVAEPEIIYEDDDVLVINKPAGLIVHSDGRNVEPSVVDWVLEHYPKLSEVGEPWESPQGEKIPRPGIVHRLDRTTSGVMIIAKTQDAFLFLKKQFQDRIVEKRYDALVYGHPTADNGTIEAEIGRTKKKPRKWTAQFGKRGNLRAAITDWNVEGRYVDTSTDEKVTHLKVSPKTGRTHQIRVHLKSIQHPIICDHIYAEKRPCLLGLDRPALHARLLKIRLPNKEQMTFEAPLPKDFQHALSSLGTPGSKRASK